ncbi:MULTISPECIES: TRAP transporter small permease subunit [unclassified Brenneria]|uniref:TRAP transporter small permease subunit n=1 Tax=unclassified Brenneria TaxID=2634434 RepID=UPI0015540624|nr:MULTISPECIES: TRAP transporter small permease subunit [unclassified Brenneria]MBJ7222005.1 TRAP transporter small permease subunit [Brenneria sp. L3-3C-1]MEE3643248.1 TRAP transporter small permease subunit [Brenneria sp. L3_3C_1]MEE3650563.1 TRAP transporter small permease subunit [Brenneria sp. HEZEL_4_2_4]NPD00518.1 TRAP transporter small permease subunit [Brenneria sp. hezel4-2-4]
MVNRLYKLANIIDAILLKTGRICAWFLIPLTLVTLYDVVSRRFGGIGSTGLQEAEWHLHTLLFIFLFAGVMVKDMNVRVDVFRENFSEKTRLRVDLFGALFLALPYLIAVIYFGYHFALMSFEQGEGSISSHGLPHRWIIKATIPIGMTLLLLATLSRIINICRQLHTLSTSSSGNPS